MTYAYDAASRLTSMTQGSSVVQFAYDIASRRTTLTLPNGVSTQYSYDAASQLTALTYQLGATTLGDLQYTYDPGGNRIQVGGSWARTGIPQAVASAAYSINNQQLTFGPQNLTYDLNGNLTSDGVNAYSWDARNRLAAITGPVSASFIYDAVSRRSRKTINGVSTDFVYDALNPVQEQSGPAVRNLLTGLGVDEYFSHSDPTSIIFFLTDALGSTVAHADGLGALPTMYTYEPFGATSTTGSPASSPYDFTGRENDLTGLKYYRARYYQPTLQRFISEDPIGVRGGINLYEYVGGNPISRLDPLGLEACDGRWVLAGWDRVFNVVCVCYWLCVPCDNPVIWGGNKRTLPTTYGIIVHTGESVTRGDRCFSPTKPGLEKDCSRPTKSSTPPPSPDAGYGP